jgi:hypothetical protein
MWMALAPREQALLDNVFGVVTEQRLICRQAISPSLGRHRDYPLSAVISIRLERERFWGEIAGALLPFVVLGTLSVALAGWSTTWFLICLGSVTGVGLWQAIRVLQPVPIIIITLSERNLFCNKDTSTALPWQRTLQGLLTEVQQLWQPPRSGQQVATVMLRGRRQDMAAAAEYVQTVQSQLMAFPEQKGPPSSALQLILQIASQRQGRITMTEAILATGLSVQKIEAELQDLIQRGYVLPENDLETGAVTYWFPELDRRGELQA